MSAGPAHRADMARAAEFVSSALFPSGAGDADRPDDRTPSIVFAEWLGNEGGPTALVYGHYDVPTSRSSGNCGPARLSSRPSATVSCMPAVPATTKARCSHTSNRSRRGSKTAGRLPVNVKFVIEGEEEVGSNNYLDEFLSGNRDLLKCDLAVVSDTSQYAPGSLPLRTACAASSLAR